MNWTATVVVAAMVVVSTPSAAGAATPNPTTAACVRPSPVTPQPTAGPQRYADAIAVAAQRGLQVWVEADLAKRWMQGSASFDVGVRRIAQLASRPGVVGIKIADELGYRDSYRDRPACVLAFLHDAALSLRAAVPHRLLLVDFIVPALGCASGVNAASSESQSCQDNARLAYPALTLAAMDRVAGSGYLDAIDLSTGLLDAGTYQSWGINALTAQQAAWREVIRRGWAKELTLNARKALAHPGPYPGSSTTAETDTQLFVGTPSALGAKAVDVWTWRQFYQGGIYRLMNPGLESNALWSELQTYHDRGAVLMTHFSPSSVESSVTVDLATIALAFRVVFVAAGVG
jgi:hypothetical protein